MEISPSVNARPVVWPANYNEVPKEVFVRADIFDEELRRIFYGAEWHPVAHAGELPNPGDFKTFVIGRVPLLITRAADGEIHVFFNACSHRGNQVETQACGNKFEFECPYHRWLFNSAGELVGCPNQREFSPGFERKDYPLAQPRTAFFHGLIFVTLSPDTPPLDEFLGKIKSTLLEVMAGDGRLKLIGYQRVKYKTNWKAYCDNDGYHAPLLHRAFQLLNWQGGKGRQYATEERGHMGFESELTVASGGDMLRDPSIIEFKGVDPSKGSRVVELFPFFIATKHLDSINLRFAIARSVDETEVHYAYFHHLDDDAEMIRHRIRQASNLLGPSGLVSMEDASIFHRIHVGNQTPGNVTFQKGVTSRDKLSFDFKQNDETGNLPRWEYYRRIMGFAREAV
jgi:anthranilate 1,2-dioxygenase large subunit